jgi:hypothetical protein
MVIADAGFWIALLNRRDRHHRRAVEVLGTLGAEGLVTTWLVLGEACHLLLRHAGQQSVVRLLGAIQRRCEVFTLTIDHLPRITQLMVQYESLMDLADASLVILAESIGSGRILSTDCRDFHTYRWKNRKPFENLLLP